MTAVPATAAPPGAAGAPPAPAGTAPVLRWRGQRVRVPWRLVASGHYTGAALRVYVKIAALAARGREGCTAAVTRLAEYLGMSVSAVERALRQLCTPDPDGVTEITTVRRTLPGGTGTTARRHPRPTDPGERWVWLPVATADTLPPRLLRPYAALAYAQARRLPITELEIGRAAGVTARSASGALDELETRGWVTVHRRAGHQGRHQVQVHEHPLQAVPTAPVGSEDFDGSGPEDHGGSLAIEEDHRTDRRDETPVVPPSAVGEVQEPARETPVDNPPPRTFRGAAATRRSPDGGYTGPPLQLSPRVWHVLEPVRDLLPGISPYLLRRAARDIGTQLDAYATPDRLAHRLTVRRAQLPGPIRDPGRWLLGAALPRWGCGLTGCESGVLWHSGVRCEVCAETAADRARAGPAPPGRRPPVWHECDACQRPSRTVLPAGLCLTCRSAQPPPPNGPA